MIMCKTTSNEEGVKIEVPIDNIRLHSQKFSDGDPTKVVGIVADLVRDAAIKGTRLILENNWYEPKPDA